MTKAQVKSWEVIDRPSPFGNPSRNLRIQVTYVDGTVKTLAPSFAARSVLDKYINRFHPELQDKESA